MPEKIIKDELKAVNNPRDTKVSNLARKLGVSDLALATRMVSLKLIEKNVYKDFRKEHKAKMEKFLAANEKKKKKGNPDPYRLRANRNGKLFSRLVLNIYRSGQISGVDWYRLTGVKLNKLDRYQEVL